MSRAQHVFAQHNHSSQLTKRLNRTKPFLPLTVLTTD